MAKGQQYERDFCKFLSTWWSNGEHSDLFWRTHGSGGRATARTKQGKKTRGQYGDLCATHPDGEDFCRLFTVELKNGYPGAGGSLHHVLDEPEGRPIKKDSWREWVQKTMTAAEENETPLWMICHKRSGREPLLLIGVTKLTPALPIHPGEFNGRVASLKFPNVKGVMFLYRYSRFFDKANLYLVKGAVPECSKRLSSKTSSATKKRKSNSTR